MEERAKGATVDSPSDRKFLRMPFPLFMALLFYLGVLSATQTVYGWSLMPLRWVALALFGSVACAYWLIRLNRGQDRIDFRGLPQGTLLFLAFTLPSIFASENFSFSGLRWLSVAILILTFSIFLRGLLAKISPHQLLLLFKVITLTLLIISIFFPAPKTVFTGAFFQGAMGDPNSLGHVALIATLVYLHGAFAATQKHWRFIQGTIAFFSLATMALTFARSSMMAFITGIILISVFYRITQSLLAKALVFLAIAIFLASPFLHERSLAFLQKEKALYMSSSLGGSLSADPTGNPTLPGRIFQSRESLWSEAWRGFTESPLVGWGFGLNMDSPKTWVIGYTAIGMTRDITNDPLFILEGCGLIGLMGYISFVLMIWKQSPSRAQVTRIHLGLLQNKDRIPRGRAPRRSSHLGASKVPASQTPSISPPEGASAGADSRDHAHAIFYVLSMSLWMLFMFDGTAFSAGSLISVLFWISAGICGSLWASLPQAQGNSLSR